MKEKIFIPPPDKGIQILDDHPKGTQKRILIMEDEASHTKVLRQFLDTHNFEVVFATSATEALQDIQLGEFDVIICNMIKAVFAGEMFYKAVERVKPHLCPRFLYMTGERPDAKTDAFIHKVNGVKLWKPFEMHVLLETIELILKKSTPVRGGTKVLAMKPSAPPGSAVRAKESFPIREIQALTRLSLRTAQKSISFAATNFSPDETLIKWLTEAAQRSVNVEIVVPLKTPGQVRDMIPGPIQQKFIDLGIALFEGNLPAGTSRMVIIDQEWVCLSQSNCTYENVNIVNGPAAQPFMEAFKNCRSSFRRMTRVEQDQTPKGGSPKLSGSLTQPFAALGNWFKLSLGF